MLFWPSSIFIIAQVFIIRVLCLEGDVITPCSLRFHIQESSLVMVDLYEKPSLFECIFWSVTDENKPSELDDNSDKTSGQSGEIISVSYFSINGDG